MISQILFILIGAWLFIIGVADGEPLNIVLGAFISFHTINRVHELMVGQSIWSRILKNER